MTRSGLACATLAARRANGQRAGTLQSWNLPRSSSSSGAAGRLAALRRQPVSPKAAIEGSAGLTTGSGTFSTPAMGAALAPAVTSAKRPARVCGAVRPVEKRRARWRSRGERARRSARIELDHEVRLHLHGVGHLAELRNARE